MSLFAENTKKTSSQIRRGPNNRSIFCLYPRNHRSLEQTVFKLNNRYYIVFPVNIIRQISAQQEDQNISTQPLRDRKHEKL
jgi:hypothetical protein